jgi:hypothetical protein
MNLSNNKIIPNESRLRFSEGGRLVFLHYALWKDRSKGKGERRKASG